MYRDAGRLVLSPSDLVGYLYCEHLTELTLDATNGVIDRPSNSDPGLSVVRDRGIEHEKAYLSRLRADGLRITEIPGEGELGLRAELTEAALADGPDVIYQATFFHAGDPGPAWRGHADFLTRVPEPSLLGEFSYEPEDTKLARHVRPSAVLQLCEYAVLLSRHQGHEPKQIHVVLAGEETVSLRLADFAAYFRAAKARFVEACTAGISVYPQPVDHCSVCSWREHCDSRWVGDDHLILVPGLRADHARTLAEVAGITTVSELAAFPKDEVHGINKTTFEKLHHQAALQVQARSHPDEPPPYELLELSSPGLGLGALPEPSMGDLFFDIEGDPFVGSAGLEYLLGVGWLNPEGAFEFRAFWAHGPEEERASFEAFIDFVTQRKAAHPDLHIYHYAPYEKTALGKLMSRYGTREVEVDALFRADVLVDLYRVVKQAMRVGTPSYSLKKLEALYMPARTQAITDAGSSIVEYERWLASPDKQILDDIEEYNRVDCDSTRLLRSWLEERREDFAAKFGRPPPRPAASSGEAAEGVAAEVAENDALRRALGAGGASTGPASDPGVNARRLLGELLDWYRREEKPVWWEYFHRVYDCDDDALFDDTEAIAGLEYLGEARQEKKSTVHRYSFDPAQEFKLSVGTAVFDPATIREQVESEVKIPGPGTLCSLDAETGTLELKRLATSSAPHPRSIIPGGPLPTGEQRQALRRIAASVVEHGIDGDGPYRAVRDLLLRSPPRTQPASPEGHLVLDGEDAPDAVVRVGSMLDGGYLAVQGPPGSGKTRAAATLTLALVRAGKTVGITAGSHSVITNLLDEVGRQADIEGVVFRASQKGDSDQVSGHPSVSLRSANQQVADDLAGGANIIAGTAWMFSRPEFDQSLDYLIIDEAGQLSLANAVAVGGSARNVVLVGDPLQLAQPSKGTHPEGADAPALGHVLGEAGTLPDDLGIFLDHTQRLHPEICRFISEIVYEDRLHPIAGLERQAISGEDELSGSGIRWKSVEHSGNRVDSPEEAQEILACYQGLLGRTFTDRDGTERPVGSEDILVVAPYNAQVRMLKDLLPTGALVGTVDRFQGRQAPIVICSLTTSSIEEIPRGIEFLLSRNRLNVAVSRAQALALMIGSPALLTIRCRSVEQIRLVNGLCRYVEMAT